MSFLGFQVFKKREKKKSLFFLLLRALLAERNVYFILFIFVYFNNEGKLFPHSLFI